MKKYLFLFSLFILLFSCKQLIPSHDIISDENCYRIITCNDGCYKLSNGNILIDPDTETIDFLDQIFSELNDSNEMSLYIIYSDNDIQFSNRSTHSHRYAVFSRAYMK